MKSFATGMGLGALAVLALAAAPPARLQEDLKMAAENSAQTYEHLATSIIEIRQTENGLVKGIVMHSAGAAGLSLARATRIEGNDKKSALELAATCITDAANEGDKPIQAIRQRLSKAGHTHHTDADTKEDYLYIDSKEKKKLLDLAQRVSKMDETASADEINMARDELRETIIAAVKEE